MTSGPPPEADIAAGSQEGLASAQSAIFLGYGAALRDVVTALPGVKPAV